jgi:CheY-like chemotaxis protein
MSDRRASLKAARVRSHRQSTGLISGFFDNHANYNAYLAGALRAVTDWRRRALTDGLSQRLKNIIALVKSIAPRTDAAAAMVGPPAQEGSSAKQIGRTVNDGLRGAVDAPSDPEDLSACFAIPADRIASGSRPQPLSPSFAPPREDILTGCTILVVEDQCLIALDVEEMLRELGATDVYLSPSIEDARSTLAKIVPDAAVLDFNLGGPTSVAIGDSLTEMGVPFVFATGYSDNVMIPVRFHDVPIVRKPLTGAQLAAQISLARKSHERDASAATVYPARSAGYAAAPRKRSGQTLGGG